MSNLDNLKTVFERIIKMCENDEDNLDMFMTNIDNMLDDLFSDDAFGTDGQSDPRGDNRNGNFTMWGIEEK